MSGGTWTRDKLMDKARLMLLDSLIDGRTAVTRAPCRLDVLGGIGDYSGSKVIEMPFSMGCITLAGTRKDGTVRAVSLGRKAEFPVFEMSLEVLLERAPDCFNGKHRWAAYVAGAIPLLSMKGYSVEGMEIIILSDIPPGSGLASSAALEVASLSAGSGALGIDLGNGEIPKLAQEIENRMALAPCGYMDQATVYFGKEGRFLVLDCKTEIPIDQPPVPEGVVLWGMTTGKKHSIGGRIYGNVRCGAFMGLEMAKQMTGKSPEEGKSIQCLADLDVTVFQARIKPGLPERMTGKDFLQAFPQGTRDDLTTLMEDEVYPVRAAASHPVEENHRVGLFHETVRALNDNQVPLVEGLEMLGDLVFSSHESYRACGLSTPEADAIVEKVRESREKDGGLFGARITGGGSGGTVMILGNSGSEPLVKEIADTMRAEYGGEFSLHHGSSPGCREIGVLEV